MPGVSLSQTNFPANSDFPKDSVAAPGPLMAANDNRSKSVGRLVQGGSMMDGGVAVADSGYYMYGWLTKRGGVRKNWLKRWFRLNCEHRLLEYYRCPKQYTALGTISLATATCARKSQNPAAAQWEFELITPERTYCFRCENQISYDSWLQSVHSQCGPNPVPILPNSATAARSSSDEDVTFENAALAAASSSTSSIESNARSSARSSTGGRGSVGSAGRLSETRSHRPGPPRRRAAHSSSTVKAGAASSRSSGRR